MRLCSFQWRDVINEMQANVPTLGCIQRKSLKRVRKRSYLVQDDGIFSRFAVKKWNWSERTSQLTITLFSPVHMVKNEIVC